ncbi:MAG: hypothetical protein WCP62_02320, partial [Planctomycetota bacterium]
MKVDRTTPDASAENSKLRGIIQRQCFLNTPKKNRASSFGSPKLEEALATLPAGLRFPDSMLVLR